MRQRRFVTASERSRQLLHGAYLLGVVQDMPVKSIAGSDEEKAWVDWSSVWQDLVDQAREIQRQAMDWCIVNGGPD